MSSSFRVESHHFGTKLELVVLSGGFFFGRAERRPDVFLGGIGKLPRINARIFVCGRHSRHAAAYAKLISGIQINRQNFFYLRTQIAVSHKLGFA